MKKKNVNQKLLTPGTTYKARLFEMIFHQKEELLELYNAINQTAYKDPGLLEINTLKNAIYMSMHNDISFIIDSHLSLYEHQSTYSPNLPLRYLFYIADLYSVITKDTNLYGTKNVKLPTPKFITFYNGAQELPDVQEQKLSDSFLISEPDNSLELKSIILNINPGHNIKLLEACQTLKHYSVYCSKVRLYARTLPLDNAVEKAISECIKNGILANFLHKYKAEAKSMSIYEYNEEKHMQQTREEGIILGKSGDVLALLYDLGNIPDTLVQTILQQNDPDTLTCWLKLAARSVSVEDFQNKLSCLE